MISPHPRAVLILGATLAGCAGEPGDQTTVERSAGAQAPAEAAAPEGGSVVLIYAEHKTVKHPSLRYFASVWPDGIMFSFTNSRGNFADYEFPTAAFPLGQQVHLLSRGSPDLLPVRVSRIAANDFRIEWLPASPPPDDGTPVVQSQ